ncbi:MAG: hypothetical protein HC887_08420 [Desulfobacteraceae bacterium]|nr:hypothetical protein [Desulfobacteraceae bacterium]
MFCSEFTDYAETKIGGIDQNNPYLYNKSKINNIETYVIKWSDLIHSNRRKLSYLGYALQTKDRSVKEVFEKDYPDIATSDLYSKLSIIKE